MAAAKAGKAPAGKQLIERTRKFVERGFTPYSTEDEDMFSEEMIFRGPGAPYSTGELATHVSSHRNSRSPCTTLATHVWPARSTVWPSCGPGSVR